VERVRHGLVATWIILGAAVWSGVAVHGQETVPSGPAGGADMGRVGPAAPATGRRAAPMASPAVCALPGADAGMLSDALTGPPVPLPLGAVDVDVSAPLRLALPPGVDEADLPLVPGVTPSQGGLTEAWWVGDISPALRVANLTPGPDHGFANRFDPADSADAAGTAAVPPRAVTIHRIHFWVASQGEPTGPMEWHIWEDNGGHKADPTRDIVPPITVTGGPGHNVIDLDALGRTVTIDPPRLFEVGVAHKASNETSPDVMLDDGLPFVGDSGDFHASVTGTALGVNPDSMYCGLKEWILLSVRVGTEAQPRSPAWMIGLDVEWHQPPARVFFDKVADASAAAGIAGGFAGASRVAWADYDGDGLEDILANASTLYRNRGGGAFVDVTATAGITDTGGGGIWADYDNDGDPDFYQYTGNCVPCGQADNFDDLWRNNGDGTFTNVRAADYGGDPNAPVPRDPLPTEAAAWGDFNGDGYLDLYAANHVDWASGACFPDSLWLNEGPPTFAFRDVSDASGIHAVTRCGRGVNPGDFDGDGDLDIYVANYRLNPNLLWVNQGADSDGVPHFADRAAEQGVQGVEKLPPFNDAYGHTIGAVWGDLDRDGDQDLVAANLAHSAWRCFSDATMVYDSQGSIGQFRFKDVRTAAGVAYVETHSDPSLVDIDNDGYLDLHITHVYDGWRSSMYRNTTGDRPGESPSALYLPRAVRGEVGAAAVAGGAPATGSNFGRTTADSGPGAARDPSGTGEAARGPASRTLGEPSQAAKRPIRLANITHLSGVYPRTGWGTGWADFDRDGDMDLAGPGLWRNRASQDTGNHWLQVAVGGCGPSNRDAIGAKVHVVSGALHGWGALDAWQEVNAGRGTGSEDSRVQHFGLGRHTGVDRVEVRFPSGQQQVLADEIAIDRRLTVTEVGAIVTASNWSPRVGQVVTLTGDACGRGDVTLRWDLDADGAFDDGSGFSTSWTPDGAGRRSIAVEASAGPTVGVTRLQIGVAP
jgi:hypothetical protein